MAIDPYLGALDLARAYRSNETTASEAVDGLLARIETLDPKLGAFQAVYADDARLAAEATDAAMQSGHRVGPFHGVPFAAKDVVDIAGRITTGGSLTMADRVSPTTATIAQRLLAAGGILVGKTKTMEFSMGGWGTNLTMGTPWNPWDPEIHRTPGGSSSGSGVAVGAGLVPCAVGSDTGGSVRTPSAWNGTVGLKTTEGTLPTDGLIPCSVSIDTVGPMTRSVADAAFMYDVMAGHDAGSLERHLTEDGFLALPRADGVRGLRLGALQDADREGVEDAILALYDAALDRLRGLGAEIVPFTPPVPWQQMAEGTGLIFTAEGYVHYGHLMEDPEAPVDEDVRRRLLPGRDTSARDYIAALLTRQAHIAAFLESMQGLAALVTPTLATVPLPLTEVDQTAYPARFTRPFNYLAMCALALPMGLTNDGFPGGLQIAARRRDEIMALRIGAAFEQALGPIGHPPV